MVSRVSGRPEQVGSDPASRRARWLAHAGLRLARSSLRLALAVTWAAPSTALLPLLFAPATAVAQYQAPSEKLLMTARSAVTWADGDIDVIQLEGPVTIEFERATLTAGQAVVRLSPEAGNEPNRMRAQVVLLGDAKVVQQGAVRSGERMLVNASVAGRVRLTADAREQRDLSDSPLYRLAESIRDPQAQPAPATLPATGGSGVAPVTPGTDTPATSPRVIEAGGPGTSTSVVPSTRPAPPTALPRQTSGTAPASPPRRVGGGGGPTTTSATAPAPAATAAVPKTPVFFEAGEFELARTDDGTVAAVLSKGVKLIHRTVKGDLVEVQGQRVVLFTPIRDIARLQRSGAQIRDVQDAVTAAYVEGDARLVYTPADARRLGEQRLEAARLYYEFATDRAVLTDAVLRTVDPKANVPIIVHAKTIRQLSVGEYRADDTELSTSAFAVPTYSIRASKIYVRQDPATETEAARSVFQARNATLRAFGVPFFYLPVVGGNVSEGQAIPLRTIGAGQSSAFGTEVITEWGLFETLGYPQPRDLDISYRADYYSDRGPGGGVNARYQGGSVTETGKEPWSFEGGLRSFGVYDEGTDDIGRPVPERPPGREERFRGHALFEHQHILPDDWQAQIRAGFVTDPTFLEQWFPRQFDRGLPHDVSVYVKRQRQTEAFTLLAQFQPNEQVTTGDLTQEQFEVERLPELGYRRIGDAVGAATFYSDNTIAGLHFQESRYSLDEQGFRFGINPGLPSLGTTGITDDTIWRGDFRQQVDFPFSAGPFRVVPFAVGRYTAYTDSPDESTVHRLFGGVGARVTTAFWKVDDTVENRLLDVHRMRHVIEPELNVFSAATTESRGDVYVFDEQVDPINDVSAMQVALRQRWQTYRGGPGRWRSVDFFTLNVEANLFNNLPDGQVRRPVGFRGLYFPSLPETSVPRNAITADATWRIADTTALLADVQWNADHSRLATAAVGLVVQRDERMTYFLGTRYIDELNSNITTAAIDYQLSSRYNVAFAQSFDFGQGENVVSSGSIIRRFDTLFLIVKAAYNQTTEQSEYGFSVTPRGLGAGVDSNVLNSALETNRR